MAHVYKAERLAFSLPTMETSTRRKHRPRSQPMPIGRQTLITDKDIFGIFEPLSRHAQLTTKQIVAFDPRYTTTVRNRLTDLYHAEGEWLVRLSETLKLANSLTTDEMYRLGDYAEDLLKVRGIIPSEKWVRTSRVGGNSKAPSRLFRLAHDHMASHIALDIEIGVRAAKQRRFRNHLEIIKDAPERTQRFPKPLRVLVPPIPDAPKWIEPDALIGIDNRFFAIEADTGSESIEGVIKPKIRAYREIFASRMIDDHFGIDNLRVLFVTTDEKRMRNMIAALASIAQGGRSSMFGFACRPDLGQLAGAPAPDGRLYTQPWLRAGQDDMRLDLANK
jgi:hypothetical protein